MANKNFEVKHGLSVGGTERITSAGAGSFTDLSLSGDLNITGDVNSVSVTDLDVTDKTITLGKGQTESNSGGSGIVIDGSSASMLWDESTGEFDFNNPLSIVNSIGGDTVLNLTGSYGSGNNVALLGFARAGGAVSGDIRYVDASTDMEIGTGTAHAFSLKTSGTRRLKVHSDGKVDVGGSGGLYGLLTVTQKSGADTDEGGIGIVDSSNGRSLRLYCSSTKSYINSGNGGVAQMVLNEGKGYVGLGQGTPTYALDVLSNNGPTTARFANSDGEDTLVRIIAGSYNTELDARLFLGESDPYGMTIEYDGVSNLGYIGMNDNVQPTAAYSKRIVMPRSSNYVYFPSGIDVGIGTNAPASNLHIKNTTAEDTAIILENTNNAQNLNIDYYSNAGSVQSRINYAEGPAAWNFIPNTSNGNSALYINYSSHVGVGTSSPAGRLHISGNSDISDEDCMLIIDDVDGSAGSRIPAIMFRSNTGGSVTNQARIRGTGTQGMVLSGSSALGNDLVVQSDGVLVGSTTNLNVLTGTPKIQVGDGSGHASIQWYSGTNSVAGLYFGDATSGDARYSGYIEYRHNTNTMAFRVNGTDHVTFLANGQISCKNITATDGNGNISVGYGALNVIQANSGDSNTAVGYEALEDNTTGSNNTGIGKRAGMNITSGNYNTALGTFTMLTNTNGSRNTALGYQALYSATGNDHNTAVGNRAMVTASNNGSCTAVGSQALEVATTGGHYNTAIGAEAGLACTSGQSNVFVGRRAGYDATDANNNVFVGQNTQNDNAGTSNQVVLGNTARSQGGGKFTVGTSSSTYSYLTIGSSSWSGSSDVRLKKEITDSTAGLSFINDLRPITFKWKTKGEVDKSLPHYEKDSNEPAIGNSDSNVLTKHGFIAQEVKAVIDNHTEIKDGSEIWEENRDGVQNFSPTALIPMLVKSIQELKTKNDALEARIETLEG